MIAGLPLIVIAVILGIKHSYDADHLLAVSNFLRKAKTRALALEISMSWAIGHMLAAALITIILFYSGGYLLKSISVHFEKIVGLMLIMLGLWSIKGVLSIHSHKHSHGNIVHSHPHLHSKTEGHEHRHMFGIGIIHGLASNDELLMLFTVSLGISTLGGILLSVGAFSVGVVIGMVAFALAFSYPLIKGRSEKVYNAISLLTGASGAIYGALMLFALV